MKMGKKVREYKAGDFIFAKVKGYPAWPARVQRPNGKKYFVYFYGTGETANLPPNMIFDYAENKDKFLSKAVKRRDFNDGVKQIEHDFANNVPLEQVIGVAMEVPEESANDTANDSAINDTIDDAADTTAAEDTTVADESAVNTTSQNEPMVEDSDETGALVIDEGKKGRKSTVKPAVATPKPMKEPKTPRGKKKEEAEESKEEEKKDEEIVSRSGRKIRPKRYIDEQTEENTTLPSPAPKKRRGASPTNEKDDKIDKPVSKSEKADKGVKVLNTLSQAELEDLKEPFCSAEQLFQMNNLQLEREQFSEVDHCTKSLHDNNITCRGDDKENILIAYLPQGQYVGIKLFQSRPTSFKNDQARLQWDKQQATNAITLKQQLERGQITSQSVITHLVMDLNLTDEEKATLDKERETEEKKSRVQFLKTEMKLIELEAKIKTCLCLEKADTELCLKLLDEFMELDVKPLMLLKHPSCGETVKRLRAYVGNAPSWELSEAASLAFAKQAHRIRRRADVLYRRVKELFTVPEGLSFWEFFSERVELFKKVTANLSPDELLELVHEPLEMSVPTAHTMKASVEAANDEESTEDDNASKKKTTAKQKKPTNNSTPSKPAVKRQSSRKQPEEKEKEQNSDQDKAEEASLENAEKESKETDKAEEEKETAEAEQNTEKTGNSIEETNSEDAQGDNLQNDSAVEKTQSDKDETVKTNNNSSEKGSKAKDESDKVNKTKTESDKGNKTKDDSEKSNKTNDESDKGSKSKDDSEKANKTKDEAEKGSKNKNNSNKESSKSKSPSPNEKEKDSKSPKDTKGNDAAKTTKEDKTIKSKEDKAAKEEKDKAEEKDKEDEPRAKRSRESKKTDIPPRSPTKRKSKF